MTTNDESSSSGDKNLTKSDTTSNKEEQDRTAMNSGQRNGIQVKENDGQSRPIIVAQVASTDRGETSQGCRKDTGDGCHEKTSINSQQRGSKSNEVIKAKQNAIGSGQVKTNTNKSNNGIVLNTGVKIDLKLPSSAQTITTANVQRQGQKQGDHKHDSKISTLIRENAPKTGNIRIQNANQVVINDGGGEVKVIKQSNAQTKATPSVAQTNIVKAVTTKISTTMPAKTLNAAPGLKNPSKIQAKPPLVGFQRNTIVSNSAAVSSTNTTLTPHKQSSKLAMKLPVTTVNAHPQGSQSIIKNAGFKGIGTTITNTSQKLSPTNNLPISKPTMLNVKKVSSSSTATINISEGSSIPLSTPAPASNKRPNSMIYTPHQHHLLSTTSQKRKKFRSPLADMYDPYIQPCDNNLTDARKRLQVALEQTRTLRMAFTNRVYEKYRVILRMQSLALKPPEIASLIRKNPKSHFESLVKDIDLINKEKELEKKEAQHLNLAVSGSSINEFHKHNAHTATISQPNNCGLAGSHSQSGTSLTISPTVMNLLNGVENTEQLSWYNSGLSLVVLPEEEMNEGDEHFFKRNIGVGLDSSCKVKEISPAAAVAANIMLDRVRKGKQLRLLSGKQAGDEMHHVHNYKGTGKGDIDTETNTFATKNIQSTDISTSHQASNIKPSASKSINPATDTKRIQGKSHQPTQLSSLQYSFTSSTLSSPPPNNIKKKVSLAMQSPTTGVYNTGSGGITGNRPNRPRASNSLVTLLSLSPTIEGKRKSGKLSACASALVTSGISHIPSSKKGGSTSLGNGANYNNQHNVPTSLLHSSMNESQLNNPHPFPSSKGAMCSRSDSLLCNQNNPYFMNLNLNSKNTAIYKDKLLPPLLTSIKRKKQKDDDLVNFQRREHVSSKRGENAIKAILENFQSCDEAKPGVKDKYSKVLLATFDKVADYQQQNDKDSHDLGIDETITSNSCHLSNTTVVTETEDKAEQAGDEKDSKNRIESRVLLSSSKSEERVSLKRHLSEIAMIDNIRKKKVSKPAISDNIDPMTALSVLHAIGFVSNKPNDITTKNPFVSIKEKLTAIENKDDSILEFEKPRLELQITNAVSQFVRSNTIPDQERSKGMKTSNSQYPINIKLASFVPSLRGGGDTNESSEKKSHSGPDNNGENYRNPYNITVFHSNNNTQSSHRPAPHQQYAPQQVQQLNNADMIQAAAALWSEQQNRNDLALLHANTVPSMLSRQSSANIDRYPSLMTAGTSNNPVNVLHQGSIQTQNHQTLPQSMSGVRDQFLHSPNASVSNHQLHLTRAQNALQQTSPVNYSNHVLHHRPHDLNEYLSNSLQQSQESPNFNTRQNDWSTLTNHGLLSANHAHNTLPRSSLDGSPINLSSHQAAMLVREHATQVLLAREHQQQLQAQVVASQRNAAALAQSPNSGFRTNIASTNFAASSNPERQQIVTLSPKNHNASNKTNNDKSKKARQRTDLMSLSSQPTIHSDSTLPKPVGHMASKPKFSTSSKEHQSSMLLSTIEMAKLSKLGDSFDKKDTINDVTGKPMSNLNVRQEKADTQKVVTQMTVPQKVVPQKVEPQKVVPQKVVPQKAIPQKVVPQKAVPQKVSDRTNNVGKSVSHDEKIIVNIEPKPKPREDTQPTVQNAKDTSSNNVALVDNIQNKKTESSAMAVLKTDSQLIKQNQKNKDCKDTDREKNCNLKGKGDTDQSSLSSECKDCLHQTQGKDGKEKCAISGLDDALKLQREIDDCTANIIDKGILLSSSTKHPETLMRFFIPPNSDKIDDSDATKILKGSFHLLAISKENFNKKQSVLEYMYAVGSAVPLPKNFVLTPLQDYLVKNPFKALVNSLDTNTTKEIGIGKIISSVIRAWVWANYSRLFEKKLAESVPVDSDPHCKWIAEASVEVSVRHLLENQSRLHKLKESDKVKPDDVELQFFIATVVNEALSQGLSCNEEMDYILPNLDSLVEHLDELRMCALRGRSQERALLASLVSRRSRMSEAFSHAYTSSMIRAGEALGYDELGETVQDETTKTSTLMPFDILGDTFGSWEDPCRPNAGFIGGLDSDELFKRAHARAIIQKSLKKLQHRHLIKGGTASAGPYADVQPSDQGKLTIKASSGVSSISPPKPSPRSVGTKRKSSISGTTESHASAIFNPNHHSAPFVWDTEDVENTPYGRSSEDFYMRTKRPGLSFSFQGVGIEDQSNTLNSSESANNGSYRASKTTKEVEWSSVANLFSPVTINEKSSSRLLDSHNHHHSVAVPAGSTIIAPYCRKFRVSKSDSDSTTANKNVYTISDNDDDTDTEEDLNDEKILESHQKVLNHIKEKFNVMMEVRQQIQERQRRARSS